MVDREKVLAGLEACADHTGALCRTCPYDIRKEGCISDMARDALELLKEQSAIVDALVKVGYPHNFQREPPWIVNYMYSITDVIRKAVHLRNEEVKQNEEASHDCSGS